MAIPKVFVSSTCYDLMQIRDSLFEFISEQYLEPILSEKGDVFFHPDLHTHESCIDEIDNCQLFILLIGGRFGGKYKYDPTKSITNAEYEAAIKRNIPVYTFVRREVYEDHRLYQSNKYDDELVKKITFPSIEKQDYAVNIFEFINKVRLADVNNGFFTFELVKEIKENLGKQWAGLLYNYLYERANKKEDRIFQRTLDNLTLVNKKTEELVESIYKNLNPDGANKEISNADKIVGIAKFYNSILELYDLREFLTDQNKIVSIEPDGLTWFEYLSKFEDFTLVTHDESPFNDHDEVTDRLENRNTSIWLKLNGAEHYWPAEKEGKEYKEIKKLRDLYGFFDQSTSEQRMEALKITNANTR